MGLGWVQVLMILDPFVRWWWLHIINLVAAVFAFWAALKVRKCAMRIREIEQEIEKAKKLIRNHENQ